MNCVRYKLSVFFSVKERDPQHFDLKGCFIEIIRATLAMINAEERYRSETFVLRTS